MAKKKKHETYVAEVEKQYKGTLDVKEKYAGSATKIQHFCVIHDCLTKPKTPQQVLSGQNGCDKCKAIKLSQTRIHNLDKVNQKIQKKFGNKYFVEPKNNKEYKNRLSVVMISHVVNGEKHHFPAVLNEFINSVGKCPVCKDKYMYSFSPTLKDTVIDIEKWLVNHDDACVSYGATKVVALLCPTCGKRFSKKAYELSRRGTPFCNVCGDGISYPNKLIYNILVQADEISELKREVSPKWCRFNLNGLERRGIYDVVFSTLTGKYIVEMDGMGHGNVPAYKGLTPEEALEVDKLKDTVASQNGYTVVRIDSHYENKDRFEFIKHNILESPLTSIIDFTRVDFEKAHYDSLESNRILCCNMWNEGKTVGEIQEALNISHHTVQRHLEEGNSRGMCNYKAGAGFARTFMKKVVRLNGYEVYDSVTTAAEENGIDTSSISHCCMGEKLFVKNMNTNEITYWMYEEEYLPQKELEGAELFNYIGKRYLEMYNRGILKQGGKIVVCLTTNTIFMNAKLAGKYYGVDSSCILKSCKKSLNGPGKIEGKFLKWIYYEKGRVDEEKAQIIIEL